MNEQYITAVLLFSLLVSIGVIISMSKRIKDYKSDILRANRLIAPDRHEVQSKINDFVAKILKQGKGRNVTFNVFRIDPECFETYDPIKYQSHRLYNPHSYSFDITSDNQLIITYKVNESDSEITDVINGVPGESFTLMEVNKRKVIVKFTEQGCCIKQSDFLLVHQDELSRITLTDLVQCIKREQVDVTVHFSDGESKTVSYKDIHIKESLIGDPPKIIIAPHYLRDDKSTWYGLSSINSISLNSVGLEFICLPNTSTFFSIE